MLSLAFIGGCSTSRYIVSPYAVRTSNEGLGSELESGDSIEVTVVSGETYAGVFESVGESALTLDIDPLYTPGQLVTVPLEDIRSLEKVSFSATRSLLLATGLCLALLVHGLATLDFSME